MKWIEGVEAIFGYCAFDVSTCSVIEENNGRRKDCSNQAVVHHKGEYKYNLHDSLCRVANAIAADKGIIPFDTILARIQVETESRR